MRQQGKIEIKLENKTLAISGECGTWDGRAFYPEYDYFLYSDEPVSDDEWKAFFCDRCCHEEERWLIVGIKKYLRTQEQREQLASMDLSLEDLLNGRYNGNQGRQVRQIFAAWNEKLGFQAFRG